MTLVHLPIFLSLRMDNIHRFLPNRSISLRITIERFKITVNHLWFFQKETKKFWMHHNLFPITFYAYIYVLIFLTRIETYGRILYIIFFIKFLTPFIAILQGHIKLKAKNFGQLLIKVGLNGCKLSAIERNLNMLLNFLVACAN